jgi:hypothetical protein
LDINAALMELAPDRASGWIHRAYALRRAPGGGLKVAADSLRLSLVKFPNEPVIPYNLACYACHLGQLKEALAWLEQAFAMGNARKVRLRELVECLISFLR